MIRIDFSIAVSVFLFLQMAIVMILWAIYTYKQRGTLEINNVQDLRQCPYCFHPFFYFQRGMIIQCPQCKSLMEMDR